MRKVAAFLTILCLMPPAFAAPQKAAAKKTVSTAKKPTAKKSTAKKSTAKKTTTAKKSTAKKKKTTTARKRSTTKKRTRRAVASWRTGQMQPAPERYVAIQQALIDKGYLGAPATGVWGPESVSALKKFQQDQNLQPNGKLDSLSLITLGLGPKREAVSPAGGVASK